MSTFLWIVTPPMLALAGIFIDGRRSKLKYQAELDRRKHKFGPNHL